MDDVVKKLTCFTRKKKKVHLICSCDDEIIDTLAQLLYNFIQRKFKIKQEKKVREKLFPFRHSVRKLADKRISIKTKRKLLVDVGIRTILYPIIVHNLLPSLLKTMKKK